ncbi:deaminase [Chryseobacterium sp. T16E-39]|uniref:dihydrofolate reductase family protein n=1 Tax=Chryseobacterium sp. T16E-39 TaxID=2015076 RepID=UPI000B5B3FD3|nr:dihydrofolate reductase family protein [Chryseobacterium sp. T16E-39]ASK32526.1 deaminase [Chryseobacterium sp. T16E-39]
MRKLKLQMQITLDGFVCGPNGEQDWVWLSPPDEVGFQKIVELADTSDTLLMGRKMTRQFIDHWENVADNMPDHPTNLLAKMIVDMRKITFSHTETNMEGRNLEVENGDLATTVEALKKESGKDILVYGGADFVSSLIDQDLIDEYYMIVNPVAIGKGLPIFNGRTVLKLENSVAFKSGKVLNTYLPVREN